MNSLIPRRRLTGAAFFLAAFGLTGACLGAWAAAAEYQTCQAQAGGQFEEAECKTLKVNGGFEWVNLKAGEKIEPSGSGTTFDIEAANTNIGCKDVEADEELKPAGASIAKLQIKECTVKELVGGRVVKECDTEAGKEPIVFETTGTLGAVPQVSLVPKGGGNEFFEIKTVPGACNKNAFKFVKKAGGSWNCAIAPVGPASSHTMTCGGCGAANKLEFNGEAVIAINAAWDTTSADDWRIK